MRVGNDNGATFGPVVVLPADILPPVRLSPIMVISPPVMFYASTGAAITGPMTAAMPNAATIAIAAKKIFVVIAAGL
jgi:hypothetical protein